ncbi:hypothetical protein EON81_14805 [bacterium]|nr:MAG: hypothetical protein EON81_14805 [bacterium]
MRTSIVAALAALLLVGCGSGPADEGVVKEGSGVPLNPGGKPKDDQEAATASKMSETGNAMNKEREAAAAAMAAAKAKAGGQ